MDTQRVLVTGAAGFIGSPTLENLLSAGYEVHAVSQKAKPARDGVQWHQANLLDAAQTTNLIERVRPAYLLHLAWDVRHGLYWTSLLNFQWVQATLHLLHTFRERGGRRAVIAGTCAEYDWQYGYCVEDVTPPSLTTPYSACKSGLYHMALRYAEQTGLSLGWGRVFFPFGPGENPKRIVPFIIQSLLKGEPAATSHGNQLRDFLYVDDLAAAFVAFLASDVEGAVNLASGDPIRLRTVILTIAELIGREDLLRIGERQAGDEPPLIVADTQRLNQLVGWQSRYTLQEGLALTIAWWKQQMGIV